MTTVTPIAQARDAWLAGDGAAWARYTACLRDLAAPPADAHRAAERRDRTGRRARRRGRAARA